MSAGRAGRAVDLLPAPPAGSGTSRARGPQDKRSYAWCWVRMSLKEVESAPNLEGASANWGPDRPGARPEIGQLTWRDQFSGS